MGATKEVKGEGLMGVLCFIEGLYQGAGGGIGTVVIVVAGGCFTSFGPWITFNVHGVD